MLPEHQPHFSEFRLDLANEQLWQGEKKVRLRRKTFEVLRYLVTRPGQLVTKAALLDGVWANVAVSDSMPSICVAELRKALGDDSRTPTLIETVHGRGYRFVAQLLPAPHSSDIPAASRSVSLIVRRDEELAQLRQWFAKASHGIRQIVFVTGEPGIGKTTFVQSFLAELARDHVVRIGRGQCIEQYGSGEPYMPVLEALTRLGLELRGQSFIEILHKFAPTWLAQMPAFLTESDRKELQAIARSVTQQRVLREMAEALEALSANATVVLALEDLHWSDISTLELISMIARRTKAARLLIIGTYRPVAMLSGEHPLRAMKEELELHQQAIELRLPLLSEPHVSAYLARRFRQDGSRPSPLPSATGDRIPGQVASAIYAHSEGNPLFMVNVVDYLIEQGSLADAERIDAPRTIRQMIERNLQRLSPNEQRILEAASVAGAEFSAAAVAAALERPIAEIESCCADLAWREQFVSRRGPATWPDGTIAAAFRFDHALYQNVLYDRLPEGHRAEIHRRVAVRLENAYCKQTGAVAVELAHHWRFAGDSKKTIANLSEAANQAAQRSANQEARQHLNAALELLKAEPEGAERDRWELGLQTTLGQVMMVLKGWAAPETERVYIRANELAATCGTAEQRFSALCGLFGVAYVSGRLSLARTRLKETLAFTTEHPEPNFLLETRHLQWSFGLSAGELGAAQRHVEEGLALYEARLRSVPMRVYSGHHPAVCAHGWGALVYHLRGFPALALWHSKQAVTLSREIGEPSSIALALATRAQFHQLVREVQPALVVANDAIIAAEETGFLVILSWANRERMGLG